ncbi:hypothetical protein [Marinimicrobium sp. ABcell2]|uniref:hypothetical protein n=1 Tax=Marinimicrobium sp. ABcell2 TaxID=3069751 RepID=UPI0027B4CE45|nr:hypothetical protein [Marinimicrobium sp. ABcell2]MDQ2077562.1 hypothetical protein [Marinimicrobium sp. ABcell2]
MIERVSTAVSAQFYEQRCPKCPVGVLRLNPIQEEAGEHWLNPVVYRCDPTVWNMRCHHCGHQLAISLPGPYIEFKDRKFVLFDSVELKINALRALIRKL